MVGDLQDVYGAGKGDGSFKVARQEDARSFGVELKDDGVIVLDVRTGRPVRRGVQDGEGVDLLAGPEPSDGDLAPIDLFEQVSILRDHRVPTEPNLSDFEILEDIEQAVNVVVMRMGQDDGIEPPDPPFEQVRAHYVFANRKGSLVNEGSIPTR